MSDVVKASTGDWTVGESAILVPTCRTCGRRWYLPRDACPSCGSTEIRRFRADGGGVVAALTSVHRIADGPPDATGPVGIALVDLDEGVRVMARCPVDLSIGQRVRVSFTPVPFVERANG